MGSEMCIRDSLFGACAAAIVLTARGDAEVYRPTERAAQAIAADWRARHSNVRLGWSAGAWPDTAMMAFYADPTIRALPEAPDSPAAAVAPHPLWRHQGGVLICPLSPAAGATHAHNTRAAHPAAPESGAASTNSPNGVAGASAGHPDPACEKDVRRWLSRSGRPEIRRVLTVYREGWRWPQRQEWRVVYFEVLPSTAQKASP